MTPGGSHRAAIVFPALAGAVAGGAIDLLYYAALPSLRGMPAESSELLMCVWIPVYFAVAPATAGIAAIAVSRITYRRGSRKAESDAGQVTARSSACLAGLVAAAAVFLLALALVFFPSVMGLLP